MAIRPDHFEIIRTGVRDMVQQVTQPLLGKPFTMELYAETENLLDAFANGLREFAATLWTKEYPLLEDAEYDDDDFDIEDGWSENFEPTPVDVMYLKEFTDHIAKLHKEAVR